MSTTRWCDKKIKDLDGAIKSLIDAVAEDERTSKVTWTNWRIEKLFSINQLINLNGRDITYNMIRCQYDQVSQGDGQLEDRTIPKSVYIVVYFNGTFVNYIINQKSSAQKMLRKLLSYKGKNEIEKNGYKFPTDFFVWLISKIYNQNNIIESDNEFLGKLRLDAIKGFRGDTEDQQTKVTATGESVINIISSLSFLLESRRLDQVRIDLTYDGHENISLDVQAETLSIILKSYQGKYETDTEDLRIAKLNLLVYLEIMLLLEQEYYSDLENENWGKDQYINFMNSIASNVKDKIQEKINYLNIEDE